MNLVRRLPIPAILCTGLLGSACDTSEPTPPAGQDSAALTYYQDVKPILDAHCVSCHESDGVAPFPLTNFEEVEPLALTVHSAVKERRMPPWPAAAGCREYLGDRSLSEEQISTITKWVELGALAGDASSSKPIVETANTELPRVDLTLATESYTPSPLEGSGDDFRCFVLDWPEQTTKYLVGINVAPGNRSIAHHLVGAVIPASMGAAAARLDRQDPAPGFGCGSDSRMAGGGLGMGALMSGASGVSLIAVWAPGLPAIRTPPGTGIKVEPGSKVFLQMHYNIHHGTGADQTKLELMLASSVEKEAQVSGFTNPEWPKGSMPILAGDPDAQHGFAADPTLLNGGTPFMISHVGLHMHVRAKSGGLSVLRADGSTECLLDIPKWDFNWQLEYPLMQHTQIKPGDQLRIECHFDNSAANQPVIAGQKLTPMDLNWGEGSTAEMCLGFYFLYPI